MVPNLWWLGLYAVLQLGRLWVISTLGRFWTTRIITLPATPLVRRGPYRFMRHPNYLVASLEIAVLPPEKASVLSTPTLAQVKPSGICSMNIDTVTSSAVVQRNCRSGTH